MKLSKHTTKAAGWIAGVTILVLIATVAVTQVRKSDFRKAASPDQQVNVANEEDSVEIIGTPTNDDPWKEIEKLANAYYDKQGISYRGTIKVIDDNDNAEKVIEEQDFEYSILDKNYHYRLGSMEFVNKKNYLLAVDHANKIITMSSQVEAGKESKLFDLRTFKNLLTKQKANVRVTQYNDEKIITIDNISDPDIQGYRIYYSPQTYRVHKMLIGMLRLSPLEEEKDVTDQETQEEDTTSEAGLTEYYYYLEVNFTSIKSMGISSKDFNPERKFFELQEGRTVVAPAFKDYRLQNNLEP